MRTREWDHAYLTLFSEYTNMHCYLFIFLGPKEHSIEKKC